MEEYDRVKKARSDLGLPENTWADVGGGIGPGVRIACKCIYCGNLFVSRSHDLADLEHICKGDCGCPAGDLARGVKAARQEATGMEEPPTPKRGFA